MNTPRPHNCWIFCNVIDNFGDIGVAWRLACELSARLNWHVWLWLDEFPVLNRIVPDAGQHPNIRLRRWQNGHSADLCGAPEPHTVIETFACTLPDGIRQTIRKCRPLWLNWEYLSAEDWALRSHTMSSLQNSGEAKYFWQMGFLPESGGLLREAGYPAALNNFSPSRQHAFRQNFRLPPADPRYTDCLVFGYHSLVWADWFAALRTLGRPIRFWLADRPAADSLHQSGLIPANALPDEGSRHVSGCLEWIRIPFVPQTRFDELLWSTDMLWVRGEDSFVRAQFAGKPMFWQIYPQQEQAHLPKLDAFWHTVFTHTLPDSAFQAAFTALSGELNGAAPLTPEERLQHWQTLLDNQSEWQRQATQWQRFLLAQSDAVTRLTEWMAAKGHPAGGRAA